MLAAAKNAAETADDIKKTAAYIARQDIGKSVEAGKLAHLILDEILAFTKPGMRESEVKAFAFARYEAHQIERPWHMPYIRFGAHTLLLYKDKAKEDLTLGETGIAFADIGIVKDGIEGDAGRTISFGANPDFQKIIDASKQLFDEGVAFWRRENPTGEELHREIEDMARKQGFVFNLDPAGHLIGAFPHKGWKKGLNHFPLKAEKGVWVLEIQIRHPNLAYGAFFEDLLI